MPLRYHVIPALRWSGVRYKMLAHADQRLSYFEDQTLMGEVLEVLERRWYRRLIRWPWFAWEVQADHEEINYYFWAPTEQIGDEIRRKILGKHPDMEISMESSPKIDFSSAGFVTATTMRLDRDYPVPIKSYFNEVVDTQAAIVTGLSDLKPGQQCVIQVLIEPARKYQRYFDKAISRVKKWDKTSEYEKIELFETNIHGKQTKQLAHCSIRIMAGGKDRAAANQIRAEITRSFGQFKSEALNSFRATEKWMHIKPLLLNQINHRIYPIAERKRKRMILNIDELSGITRLPSSAVNHARLTRLWLKNVQAPPGVIAMSKEALNSQDQNRYIHLGTNDYRMVKTPIYQDIHTLRQHMNVVGGSGTGKTVFLTEYLLDLCKLKVRGNPTGFFLIDPFGELSQNTLSNMPAELREQVNYIQPDPLGNDVFPFNVFDVDFLVSETSVAQSISNAIGRIWPEGWGPRPARNFLLGGAALQAIGNINIVQLERLLRDWKFSLSVLERIKRDERLEKLGVVEYVSRLVAGGVPGAKANEQRLRTEITDSTLNKLIHFTMSDLLGRSMGTRTCGIRWLDSMNTGRINLLDLSKVTVDEEKKMIGSLAMTLNYQAAITRETKYDNVLYPIVVEEAPMFIDANVKVIQEMADRTRQKNVPLVMASQGMITQLDQTVADAIGRNFVTHIAFRLNTTEDSEWMANLFNDPNLEARHFKQAPSGYAYARIGLGREPSRPFTLKVRDLSHEAANPKLVKAAIKRSLDEAMQRESEAASKYNDEFTPEVTEMITSIEQGQQLQGEQETKIVVTPQEAKDMFPFPDAIPENISIAEDPERVDDSWDDDMDDQDTAVVFTEGLTPAASSPQPASAREKEPDDEGKEEFDDALRINIAAFGKSDDT